MAGNPTEMNTLMTRLQQAIAAMNHMLMQQQQFFQAQQQQQQPQMLPPILEPVAQPFQLAPSPIV
ncbi:hypothetical protein JCGZ_07849 [Jatropha curcas]|uniref:Uncharacterized protein n=1 Tax=Jatropha curcas TaxID=180498 RepID=A0A067L0N3_JATCU|nr:hypothetical protein JCGZ_07849 [Jatropha curcas]